MCSNFMFLDRFLLELFRASVNTHTNTYTHKHGTHRDSDKISTIINKRVKFRHATMSQSLDTNPLCEACATRHQ